MRRRPPRTLLLLLPWLASCWGPRSRWADCSPSPNQPRATRARTSDRPSTLAGRVHGAHDARPPLPLVAVRLSAAATDTARVIYTDTAGAFRFDALPPGRYTLEFRRIGYEWRRLDALTVDPSRGTQVVVPLKRYVICERWDLRAPRSPAVVPDAPAQRTPTPRDLSQ